MRRILSLALALIIAAPAFAQTTRHSQIVLKCRDKSRRSVSGETVIYKDCQDGKNYVSRDGAAFTELAEAAGGDPSWATRAYVAGNYTGGGSMTFTVDAGDVVVETWIMLTANTVALNFNYDLVTVGGTPHSDLQITMPVTSAVTLRVPFTYRTPGGANGYGVGWALISAGSNLLILQKQGFVTWSNDTNNLFLQGIVGPFKTQ